MFFSFFLFYNVCTHLYYRNNDCHRFASHLTVLFLVMTSNHSFLYIFSTFILTKAKTKTAAIEKRAHALRFNVILLSDIIHYPESKAIKIYIYFIFMWKKQNHRSRLKNEPQQRNQKKKKVTDEQCVCVFFFCFCFFHILT